MRSRPLAAVGGLMLLAALTACGGAQASSTPTTPTPAPATTSASVAASASASVPDESSGDKVEFPDMSADLADPKGYTVHVDLTGLGYSIGEPSIETAPPGQVTIPTTVFEVSGAATNTTPGRTWPDDNVRGNVRALWPSDSAFCQLFWPGTLISDAKFVTDTGEEMCAMNVGSFGVQQTAGQVRPVTPLPSGSSVELVPSIGRVGTALAGGTVRNGDDLLVPEGQVDQILADLRAPVGYAVLGAESTTSGAAVLLASSKCVLDGFGNDEVEVWSTNVALC